LYDRAIASLEPLVEREGHPDLANLLALACMNKGTVVRDPGGRRAARWIFALSLLITGCAAVLVPITADLLYEFPRPGGPFRPELNHITRRFHLATAAVVCLVMSPWVIGWLLVIRGKRTALRRGVALYDRALAIWGRLVEQEGRHELVGPLAAACMNVAGAVNDLGDKDRAVATFDRAMATYERLVERESRPELVSLLADACMNKAGAARDLGDTGTDPSVFLLFLMAFVGGAAVVVDIAYQPPLWWHGLTLATLAFLLTCFLVLRHLLAIRRKRAALDRIAALYDRAIAVFERLIEQEGRRELQGDLARIVLHRAQALLELGDRQRAQTDARKALPLLKAEVVRTGRADFQRFLDWASRALNEVV
jgi:tetratricopeptide (TPR) repeat protein